MLTKDLLVARRYKGKISPKYVVPNTENIELAEELLGLFESWIGHNKEDLSREIEKLEMHKNFKLVRGLSQILERRCLFQEDYVVEPKQLRAFLFKQGYTASLEERESILERAAQEFNTNIESIKGSFWADREEKLILKGFLPSAFIVPSDPNLGIAPTPVPELSLTPLELLKQYNLSLTQTLLFDALELNFTASGNYQEIFRWIKYLGLMYEATEDWPGSIKVKVDGPASLFKETTKYGTSLAKLIPAITRAEEWEMAAKIRSDKNIYLFSLNDSKKGLFPAAQPYLKEQFDSTVEENFARRIKSIMRDWTVRREPTILKAGNHIFIPDFGFERRGLKYYLEIVGFWTKEYLERKLAKIKATETNMLIAVDRNLKCTEEDFKDTGKEVIFYDKTIPLEPVIARLEALGERQKQEETKRLSSLTITVSGDLVSLEELAKKYGVGLEVIKEIVSRDLDKSYQIIEDKIVSNKVLDELREKIEALPEDEGEGRDYAKVQELLKEYGLSPSALRKIGYKVECKSLLEMKVVKIPQSASSGALSAF